MRKWTATGQTPVHSIVYCKPSLHGWTKLKDPKLGQYALMQFTYIIRAY